MSDWWMKGPPLSAADALETAALADDAVTTAKLDDGAVTTDKLDATLSALADSSFTALHAHLLTEDTPVNAVAATGTLTLTGVVVDGETVTIGDDVYEFDTHATETVTSGHIAVDVSGGSTVAAQGTLTLDTLPTDGDTIHIGSTTYRFKSTLAQANDITITAADLGATQDHLRKTVNGTGVAGTDYYTGTVTPHATVSMSAFTADAAILTAKAGGTAGNSLATTETFTAGTNVFDDTTLGTTTAGVDPTASEAVTALVTAITASTTEPVTAADGTGDTVVVTAEVPGTEAESIATSTTAAHGSFGDTTLVDGVDGTLGTAWELRADSDYLYLCIADNTVADANWRRVSVGSAY
jgi:hypothetical protein